MTAASRHSGDANPSRGTRGQVFVWTASLIFTACLPRPVWGQANPWSTGSGGAIYYNGGNVGIGTTAPIYPITVNGTIQSSRLLVGPDLDSNQSFLVGKGTSYGFIAPAATYVDFAAYSWGGYLPLVLNRTGGNVGIGTANPQYRLSVNGTIGTKEVVVTNTGWADYVFKPDYRLPALSEVGAYIREHHHLPGVPSEKEVQEKGVGLGEMQAKLLAKVEELTLHMIQADQRNNRLEKQNRELQDRLARLEAHGTR